MSTDWQDKRKAEHRALGDAIQAGADERMAHPERFDAIGKRLSTVDDLLAEYVNNENATVINWEIRSRGLDPPESDADRRALLIEVLVSERETRMGEL